MKKVWNTVMRLRTIVSSFVIVTALIAGCSGGGSSGGGTTPVAAPTGTVTGQVASAVNNAPVEGATVSTTAGTTTSAADGSFTVAAGAGDRTVVHVEATGFAEAFPVSRVTAGQTTGLGVRLLPTGVSTSVTVASGGTVTVPNSPAQVIIPANGLVPKAGGAAAVTVNVAVTPINPAVDVKLMPGDFMAVPAGGGSPLPIESFGALLIDIRDSAGTRYTLAPNKTSTIRIPLGTLSANPPSNIPLWFFDEVTGLWKEEGTATLQGIAPNQYYEGTVTHFSFWNADQVLDTVFVTGCVRDADNQPVAGLIVESNGIDYTGSADSSTAADGTFRVAMRLNSRATLGLFEFDLQTVTVRPVSNVVNVGPSTVDFTLPNCLVKAPGPLTITTSALPGGNVGAAYNQTLAATGGIPGYVWSLDPTSNPLPTGLSLNPSGVVSGSPTTAGTTTIIVKVTDSASGTATKPLSLTISPPGVIPIIITSLSPLPSGTVGVAYTISLTSSGGTPSLSWGVVSGALPVGLTLNPSTGQISGTPTAQGISTFTIRVQDSGTPQQSDQKQFSLTVNSVSSGGGGTLTVANAPASVGGTFVADASGTPNNFPGGVTAVAWLEQVNLGTGGPPESISVSFDTVTSQVLGILFQPDKSLPGTAWECGVLIGCAGATVNGTAGTFTLVNTVLAIATGSGSPITLNGTLIFTPLSLTINITSFSPLLAGTVGTVYSTTLFASGGTPSLSWSVVSGALPVGLTLNPSTGQISGTPTAQGISTFTIQVQDSGTPQQSDQKQFSLTVNSVSSGGGGTLTVANAPASVGGTFVADPQFTQINVVAGLASVGWGELTLPGPHGENVMVALDLLTGQVLSLTMNEGVGLVFTNWQCALPPGFPCAGVTVNRATGTASITNTVLPGVGGTGAPPITLNGTLTFTPF